MAQIKLTSEGLKNSLKKLTLEEAIIEYVWNGLDAKATRIDIIEEKNLIGGTSSIKIVDNGTGIDRALLDKKFSYVYVSEKNKKESIDINVKGKKGIGRYGFFEVANSATWNTVYVNSEGEKKSYLITINGENLIDYNVTPEEDSTSETGTMVTLFAKEQNLNMTKLVHELKLVYAWYLQLYKDKKIYVNGLQLDCSELLNTEHEKEVSINGYKGKIIVCIWNNKLSEEYSKYYYIDSSGEVHFKENTTLNNKGDNFYHSVFVISELFDSNFYFTSKMSKNDLLGAKSFKSDEFKELRKVVDSFLFSIRKPFIKGYAKKFIAKLKEKKVYPQYDTNNIIDRFKEEQLDELIANVYYFVPNVFTNLSDIQQKTLIRMFELILNSGETNNLFKILDNVVELTTEERSDMADLLDKVELSNMLEMQQLIIDRLQAIQDFKTLLFDKDRYVNEVDHVQKFIEKHYWFFGEQYRLVTAEEPNFEEALRRYLNIVSDCYYEKGTIKMDSPDRKKQMDIFAVRQMPDGEIKKCIVVELKRPSVVLGMEELNQIKKYFKTIRSDSRFNATNIEWEFYLVGNDYDNDIKNEIENAKNWGIRSLVYKIDNCNIYVKKWSEIFTELELNFNYLNEKLKFDYQKLEDSKHLTSAEIILKQEISNS